ncbi:MAG: hypothetical protein ABH829_04115 [archaeon]
MRIRLGMFMLCLPANIVSVIVGAILFRGMLSGAANPYLLGAFALVTIAAQFLYLMHRGVRPLAGPMSLVILVLSTLLFRYSLGNLAVFDGYVAWLVGTVVVLQIAKLPVG